MVNGATDLPAAVTAGDEKGEVAVNRRSNKGQGAGSDARINEQGVGLGIIRCHGVGMIRKRDARERAAMGRQTAVGAVCVVSYFVPTISVVVCPTVCRSGGVVVEAGNGMFHNDVSIVTARSDG